METKAANKVAQKSKKIVIAPRLGCFQRRELEEIARRFHTRVWSPKDNDEIRRVYLFGGRLPLPKPEFIKNAWIQESTWNIGNEVHIVLNDDVSESDIEFYRAEAKNYFYDLLKDFLGSF